MVPSASRRTHARFRQLVTAPDGRYTACVSVGEAHDVVKAVFRSEAPRLIARLTRFVGDVARAEELAQDALVAALEHWPSAGIPANPGAWLMTTAQRRGIDERRRGKRTELKQGIYRAELEASESDGVDVETSADDVFDDDLLRLVFIACHPVLPPESRVALTLRLLGGLTTAEIARAFLTSETTVAQRIVRAKRALAAANVPFEVPPGDEIVTRLSSVLDVVYLIFNEGFSATAGDDWMRPALCDDALRLGRVLAELVPHEAEVHGLVALMELQAARTAGRTGPSGELIPLLEQRRDAWDERLIGLGLASLRRAELAAVRGPFALQAAIAACHVRAQNADETDWARIAELYGELARREPSPVVEVNRAVSVAMAHGPEAGLAVVDAITSDEALQSYHLLPAVRGDLLYKLGRLAEAEAEFSRAARLTQNERERDALLERADACLEV
jgi:RNA polymerase sigma factor (sigma-70 family)